MNRNIVVILIVAIVVALAAGGGGWGPAGEREAAALARDRAQGLTTDIRKDI